MRTSFESVSQDFHGEKGKEKQASRDLLQDMCVEVFLVELTLVNVILVSEDH